MKNLNTIKRITQKLLFVALLLLLLPCFAFGDSIQPAVSPALKVKVPLLKDDRVKQTISPALKPKVPLLKDNRANKINRKDYLKAAMQLKVIDFVTYPNGNWVCYIVYKNIGPTTFEIGQLEFRPTQILKNGQRIPVVTKKNTIKLVPGRGHSAGLGWIRCSNDSKIMVEIWYVNRRLATKTVDVPPLNVGIIGDVCHVGIKNSTSYTVKVDYRVIPMSAPAPSEIGGGGSVAYLAIPDTTVIIPANGQITIPAITNLPNGFKLQVLFKGEKRGGTEFVVLDSKFFQCCVTGGGDQDPSLMNQLSSPVLRTQ